ncbi:sigma-54-dependent Fis family transcriptional regulator [Dechloromonas sp. XY25]|uniref:Sigma-54-dependent Fis family transcriptional regulator n=1 Tax=Dechloromonas hankyongensis TaxID=2908002 RepID=A0ABS9JYA0_9RHOO|nr:sigma-54-dependent Fis family transcriptional regulator [Dechloromonas hankyongensis]MCG2575814.1 sigma-54-dependent Fis family transcriptional regulator [Dechloromonas hankyongensis]
MQHTLTAGQHGQQLQQARQLFFDRGEVPEGLVPTTILRSWQRCRHLGLSEKRFFETIDCLGRKALQAERERNELLLNHGRMIMSRVYAQLRDTSSMVVLADAGGLLLDTMGDADFAGRAGRIALSAGASWEEGRCGTNAIGTALAEESELQVLGAEHFFEHNHFLAGCAGPIFGPDGKLLGLFSISGDYRGMERHTLGLASLSAAMVERRLFESIHARELLVCFRRCSDGPGCFDEGLAAVSGDGQILAINRAGLEILGVRRVDVVRRPFSMVFESSLSAVIDRLRTNPLASEKLEANGRRLEVRLRGQLPPLRPAAGNAGPAPRRASPVPVTFDSLSTGDLRLQAAIDRARRLVDRDIPILIQGESGAGKELFAQAFHQAGSRCQAPFVALNCASIPETLIEAELFGYEGGAYTGARKEGAPGKIQQAHGGTLFLDEIGDMPLHLQTRLLRVLQERCVTPLGSTRSIQVDISLVCATHRKLRDEVARGAFREDLYYRLNGLTVTLPPLRERSDIRQIVAKLAAVESAGRAPVDFSARALLAIERYAWPGNFRQLINVIRLAVALLDDGETLITEAHLPEELFETPSGGENEGPWAPAAPECVYSLDEIGREVTRRTLEAAGGNVSAAARLLGISRNTLYRKLGKAGGHHGAPDAAKD